MTKGNLPSPPFKAEAPAKRLLRVPKERLALMDAIAAREGLSFNAWANDVLDRLAVLDAVAQSEGRDGRAVLAAITTQLAGGAGKSHLVQKEERRRETETPAIKKAMTFRFDAKDREAIRKHAAAVGHTVTSWVVAVVRAKIRNAPILAMTEAEALLAASRELNAVGRNLNTVVHMLHREGRWAGGLDLYAQLLGEVKAVRARFEEVMASAYTRAED